MNIKTRCAVLLIGLFFGLCPIVPAAAATDPARILNFQVSINGAEGAFQSGWLKLQYTVTVSAVANPAGKRIVVEAVRSQTARPDVPLRREVLDYGSGMRSGSVLQHHGHLLLMGAAPISEIAPVERPFAAAGETLPVKVVISVRVEQDQNISPAVVSEVKRATIGMTGRSLVLPQNVLCRKDVPQGEIPLSCREIMPKFAWIAASGLRAPDCGVNYSAPANGQPVSCDTDPANPRFGARSAGVSIAPATASGQCAGVIKWSCQPLTEEHRPNDPMPTRDPNTFRFEVFINFIEPRLL